MGVVRKKWTELELTIVYYIVKHGVGGIINYIGNRAYSELGIIFFLGHGQKSYFHCRSKFKTLLGIRLRDFELPGYNPTNAQKAIVLKYENTTASELRKIINEGLEELKKENNSNTLKNDKSPLKLTKQASNDKSEPKAGDQLSFDF